AEKREVISAPPVALKFAHTTDLQLETVKREAETWNLVIGHRNVLPMLEAQVYGDYVVIASEYASGGTLRKWMESHRYPSTSLEEKVKVVSEILDGLGHLHARGVIHRDIKPENVLLQEETPRLADFGLARVLQTSMLSKNITGSPRYMAPETFEGRYSVRTDIWSVGILLYELLAEEQPYTNTELLPLINEITNKAPRPLPASVPKPLQQVIKRALQKDPAQRYRSAGEMRADLDRAMKGSGPAETIDVTTETTEEITTPLTPVPTPLPLTGSSPRSYKKVVAAVLGLAVVAAVAIYLYAKSDGSGGPPPPALTTYSAEYAVVDDRGNIALHTRSTNAFNIDLGGALLSMVEIPGGSFDMGINESSIKQLLDEYTMHQDYADSQAAQTARDNAEKLVRAQLSRHRVSLPAFYVGQHEVTREQWRAIANRADLKASIDLTNPDPSTSKGEGAAADQLNMLPVDSVTWFEAKEFCDRLSKLTGYKFRLPSEAEWEYACRAGSDKHFHTGNLLPPEMANYDGRYRYRIRGRGDDRFRRLGTWPAGSFRPSAFGLFDMHGNVWEWCLDPWHDDYQGAPSDGSAWLENGNDVFRIQRGGNYEGTGYECRCGHRSYDRPDSKSSKKGFRVVMEAPR
ncbi:MAG TPA: bifunctional serine/threonine-protein kinase/formylglycine-generating enzyme family protein, partial [Blastocatellia bacterium]